MDTTMNAAEAAARAEIGYDWNDQTVTPATKSRKPRQVTGRDRFADEDADALEHVEGSWLVKGLWPRQGLCFVAGPSMSGKSFWMIDQASRVAKGEPVLGRRSVRSGVVYVAAEGANGVRARFEGLRRKVGLWGSMIRFISDAPVLNNEEDVEVLGSKLREIKRRFKDYDSRLGMVIIDTLSASIPGVDENSAKDMSGILTTLQNLAVELEACFVIVAHLGKDAQRGIRGWSGLLANADGVILIGAPTDEDTRIGEIQKVKDGEAGGRFAFGLDVVLLGTDLDGDDITTCTIAPCDVPLPVIAKKQNRQVDLDMKDLMIAFGRLEENFVAIPDTIPGVKPGTKGTMLKPVRERLYSLGFRAEDRPDEDDEAAMKTWSEKRKKAYYRALAEAIALGKLRKEGDYLWEI